MNEGLIQYIATLCFAVAILHTFSVKVFQGLAHRFPQGSVGENLFHLLGEIEVVFGIWAGIFILLAMALFGTQEPLAYLESRNFTEPLFVFVIMAVCASKPILHFCERFIRAVGAILPLNKTMGFYVSALILGPLLGSLITEPAAMTVTALILLKNFYGAGISDKLKYATLGLLFVSISIGGTLTPYAAPPVLMVAGQWNWDLGFMLSNFGWKAALAIGTSTALIAVRFRHELMALQMPKVKDESVPIPFWVTALHLLVLLAIVLCAHHIVLFAGIFLFFLGVTSVTKEYQDEIKIRESLLVGFFLGGLVVLGGYQNWWLEPILNQLTALPLFLGSMSLTAFMDNAAITYLGAQVPNLSDISKYALVAGSVVGGGLTVIANAPNPAGYSTLNPSFGRDGISPRLLFVNALLPTLIAAICFWLL
ncbi:MAG: putative Na+/H+ antiporter [Bdellovibrionales bacterium]|nr:putative Na+/H+ antiporter [Bdellovibrionales bacterium]